MQRSLSVLLGLGVVVLAVLLVVKGMPSPHHAAASSVLEASVAEAGSPLGEADSGSTLDAGTAPATVALAASGASAGAGARMPDGTPVPPLPDKPSKVRFGVVLVTYAGAQEAPPHARPQHEARDLVQRLASDAKTDFHGAVARGDSGSTDDIGSMPRGVLEPAVEYQIFTLAVGAVSDPIETPRGYWIVKRTE